MMNLLCKTLGHKPRQKRIRSREPFSYTTISLDTGKETGQFSAFRLLIDLECERCSAPMGSGIGFEDMTIPARSEVKMTMTVEVKQ